MPAIPTNEPLELRAGDTWKWTREDLSDTPAPTWTLTYRFKNAGGGFEIVATASGANFAVSVVKATTAAIAPGSYTWQAFVDAGGERYQVDHGTLKVLPDYGAGVATVALDDRSHARKVLTAIEAILESRATKDQEEYTIAGRSLKRTPIPELLILRDRYRLEVSREVVAERIANGLGDPRRIGIRFNRV
jgi:hypothetical protein